MNLTKIKKHLLTHRPTYIWLPVIIIAVVGALHGYFILTGRQPVDDLPMGSLWTLVQINVAIILTNLTKPLLYDDIDTTSLKTPWYRVLIDNCVTSFLLFLFIYFLTH